MADKVAEDSACAFQKNRVLFRDTKKAQDIRRSTERGQKKLHVYRNCLGIRSFKHVMLSSTSMLGKLNQQY